VLKFQEIYPIALFEQDAAEHKFSQQIAITKKYDSYNIPQIRARHGGSRL
jgi:hypothetical protein